MLNCFISYWKHIIELWNLKSEFFLCIQFSGRYTFNTLFPLSIFNIKLSESYNLMNSICFLFFKFFKIFRSLTHITYNEGVLTVKKLTPSKYFKCSYAWMFNIIPENNEYSSIRAFNVIVRGKLCDKALLKTQITGKCVHIIICFLFS